LTGGQITDRQRQNILTAWSASARLPLQTPQAIDNVAEDYLNLVARVQERHRQLIAEFDAQFADRTVLLSFIFVVFVQQARAMFAKLGIDYHQGRCAPIPIKTTRIYSCRATLDMFLELNPRECQVTVFKGTRVPQRVVVQFS